MLLSNTTFAEENGYNTTVGEIRTTIASFLASQDYYQSEVYIFDNAGVEVHDGQLALRQFHEELPIWAENPVSRLARDVLYQEGSLAILIQIADTSLIQPDYIYIPVPASFDLDRYDIPPNSQWCLSRGILLALADGAGPGEPGGQYVCSSATGAVHPCECVISTWNQHAPCPAPQYDCDAQCNEGDEEIHIRSSMAQELLDRYRQQVLEFYTQPWPPTWFNVGDSIFSYDLL